MPLYFFAMSLHLYLRELSRILLPLPPSLTLTFCLSPWTELTSSLRLGMPKKAYYPLSSNTYTLPCAPVPGEGTVGLFSQSFLSVPKPPLHCLSGS